MDPQGGTGAAPTKATEPVPPRSPLLKSNPDSKYRKPEITLQLIEAIILTSALLVALGVTFYLWQFAASWWSLQALAGLAGIIAGLLHSLKWFYRTVGDGEWETDRAWWRYLNPLVCGVMGLSIYITLQAGIDKGTAGTTGKGPLFAYSVGFLTGLFADNAMNKLRDIAHVLFGSTRDAPSKPKSSPSRGSDPEQGHNA